MKAEPSIRKNRFLNLILVSMFGVGKTKFLLDCPGLALLDYDYGDLTAQDHGINVPVLHPKNEDDLRAVIEAPEMVIEKVIHPTKDENGNYPFDGYEVKTWGFDTVTNMADQIMGEGEKPELDFNGVVLPAKEATGILSLPGVDRKNKDMPEWGDGHVFGVRMRKLLLAIKQMPYHTVLTAHLGDPDHMEVSPRPDKKTGLKPKPKKGYPLLYGQLKWQLGALCDFYLELQKKGGGFTEYKYLINTQPQEAVHVKNRLQNHLPKQIDWTNKNGFDLINQPLQKAMEESLKK